MFESDRSTTLSERCCYELLGTAPLGRVVFTDRALPAVQPVDFALHGRSVIIRVSANGRLAAAVRDTVVAFQADDIEDFDEGRPSAGWHVVAVGHTREITDSDERAVAARLRPRSDTSRSKSS